MRVQSSYAVEDWKLFALGFAGALSLALALMFGAFNLLIVSTPTGGVVYILMLCASQYMITLISLDTVLGTGLLAGFCGLLYL